MMTRSGWTVLTTASGDRERGAERRAARRQLDGAVLLVHEQVGARLDFGERPLLDVEMVRSRAAARDDLGREAGRPQRIHEGGEPRPPLARLFQPLGERRHMLQMPVIGLYAAVPQARLRGGVPAQRGRRLRGR